MPTIAKREPDLLDEVEKLVGPGVELELKDQTWSRHFLQDLDRKAEGLAKEGVRARLTPDSP